jgi:protein SCO1/2
VTSASPPAVVATPFVPPLATGDALPETRLIDQRGQPFLLGGPSDGATVVTFFYTRCPDRDECALTSAKFAALVRLTHGDAAHLVEITIDPERDTWPVLRRYAAAFSADPARWTFATGSAATTDALERRTNVAVSRMGDAFVHDDAVVVLDSNGRIAERVTGASWSPSDVATVVRGVERLATDPVARIRFALTRGIAAACGRAGGAGGISALAAFAVFAGVLAAFGLLFRIFFS